MFKCVVENCVKKNISQLILRKKISNIESFPFLGYLIRNIKDNKGGIE